MPGVKWEECVKRSVCKWNKHSCRLRLCACVNCAFEWQLIYSALGEKDKRAQVSVYNRREQSECQPVHEVVQREERSASRPPSSSSSLPPAGESSDWSLSDIPNTKPSPRALAAWTRTKSFFCWPNLCCCCTKPITLQQILTLHIFFKRHCHLHSFSSFWKCTVLLSSFEKGVVLPLMAPNNG